MSKETYGCEGEFVKGRAERMPNGDKHEEMWSKIWFLAAEISSIKANGCAQRGNDLTMINEIKDDLKWLKRTSVVTLMAMVAFLLKAVFFK